MEEEDGSGDATANDGDTEDRPKPPFLGDRAGGRGDRARGRGSDDSEARIGAAIGGRSDRRRRRSEEERDAFFDGFIDGIGRRERERREGFSFEGFAIVEDRDDLEGTFAGFGDHREEKIDLRGFADLGGSAFEGFGVRA